MTNTTQAQPAKPKRSRAKISYKLVAVQKNDKGEVIGWSLVPQPTIEKENPTRADYKRAVRKALEDGQNIDDYNGKQLTVIGFPEPFQFKAKVETVEIRKVNVTEA